MKRNGMCPICYLRKMFFGAKRIAALPNAEKYDASPRQTPLMGWSSWNAFRGHIDEDLIFDIAKTMKEDKALYEAGYRYVNIDDCWQSNTRSAEGNLQGDLIAFAGGMGELAKRVNALGLKLGLYSSNGTLTCEDLPASLGHEMIDARQLAEWGVEYFKYDFCHNIKLPKYAPLVYGITVAEKGSKDGKFYGCANGTVEGLAKFMKDERLEGGRYVSGLDAGKGKLTFDNVTVDKDGEYTLTVNIKKKGQYEKFVIVEVNGEAYEIEFPSQKHYNVYARFQTVVKMKAGKNVVKLYNPVANSIDSATALYRRMSRELKTAAILRAEKTGEGVKPIIFSICEWGVRKPWLWGASAGNMWRTTFDSRPVWSVLSYIYERNVKLHEYASAGHFNDPDMLEVGNGKLNYDENLAIFTVWCFMAAPLVLGNDLRKMPENVRAIVTDKALIAIDQDALCKQAKRVRKGTVDVLAKPLADGSTAVCFFNKKGGRKTVSYDLELLKKDSYVSAKIDAKPTATALVGEVSLNGKKATATVPKHGVAAFIVK